MTYKNPTRIGMLRIRPVLFILGVLLGILSAAMIIPAIVDINYNHDDWRSFALSGVLTGFTSMLLIFANREENIVLNLRQAFILTPLSWSVLAFFAALPLYFSDIGLDFTQAFFESLSAITTTGATLMTDLDNSPPGILIWRSILQYLGGIGIIAAATAILPMLGIGGMQLFKTEGSDGGQKFLPRATQVATMILTIYVALSIACGLLYHWFGMSGFDAINHAMTTVSTAGFSTHDASLGFYDNVNIEIIAMIFMLSGALPFVAYYRMVSGDISYFNKDSQIKFFLTFVFVMIVIMTTWVTINSPMAFSESLRYAAFNIISVITTTGYSTADYSAWGGFPLVIFFLLMAVGGCTGSTTGGIKIFRLQILFETAKSQISSLINPHGVFKPHFDGKSVSENVITAVLSYFVLFALTFSITAGMLALTGLDFMTAMSAAIATLGNIGPALGETVGPSGNYSSFSDVALWICCLNMMLGRLEIFMLLVLLHPNFWRG